MISPKEVAREVQEHMDRGITAGEAFVLVAHKYDVRLEDVKIAACVRIEALWKMWCPNQRKVQVNYGK